MDPSSEGTVRDRLIYRPKIMSRPMHRPMPGIFNFLGISYYSSSLLEASVDYLSRNYIK